MRFLGSMWIVVGSLLGGFGIHAQEDSPLAKKLAEINVKVDEKALSSYQQVPNTSSALAGTIATFHNKVTGATVIVSGQDMTGSGEKDFATDAYAQLIIEKRVAMMKEKHPASTTIEGFGIKTISTYTFGWVDYAYRVTQGSATGSAHGAMLTTIRDGWSLTVLAVAPYGADAQNSADDVAHALRPLRPLGTLHPGTFEDYHGKVHGFASHLREAGWQQWPRANEFFPSNFVAARRGEGSFAVVVVVPMQGPSLAFEENFAAVMRTCTRFGEPEKFFKIQKVEKHGFAEALSFGGEVETNGARSYFGGWFGQGSGRMTLAAAWSDVKTTKDAKGVVEGATAAIEPLEVDGPPPLSTFSPVQRQMMCRVLAEIAGQLIRRGRNEDAAQAYEAALEASHTEIATLELAVNSMVQIGDVKRGDLLLGRYWQEYKDSPRAWLLRAGIRRAAGNKDKAQEDYAAAFGAGLQDETSVLQYMALMWETGKLDAALKFIEDYEKKHPSPRVSRWRANTLGRMKKYDEALPLYATLVKTRPLDVDAATQYGEMANGAGKYDVALQMVELLVNEHLDSPRTRLIEGWAHYGKKEWREAKVSFELARKEAPNDPIVLDALNSANSALGEGDSFAVKQPIEALVLPAEVQRLTDKAMADFKSDDDESGVNLVHTLQISFHKGKPTTTTLHRKIKVLDTSGVDTLSTLDIPFDPLSEHVYVNRLEVLDEDGKVLTHGKPDDQYVTDPSMDGPATLGRVLRVPVPGLRPGRTLDYVYTKRMLDPDKAMRFQVQWLGSTYPSASQCVVVEGDLADVRAVMNEAMKASVQVIEDTTNHSRTWFLPVAPQMHTEPYLPRFTAFLPVLWLGAPDADWAKVGTEYLDLIKEQLKPEPEIEALARKLTEGATSNEQKIDRLSRHVREEITYKAIEFGRRARIPNRPGRVTANHYGDCKDMALLLHHLLRGAGIESHLTLINSRMDLAPDLPDLDQFNHMILQVPSLKAQFVDCTEGKSAGVSLPPNLFELQGLVLDPAKPHLMSMPKRSDWPAGKLTAERVVRFDSEGGADVADTLEFSSYMAQNMRMFLNSMPPPRRVDSMQSWLQRASHWQLEKLEAVNVTDPSSPLTLKLRYSIPPPALAGSHSVKVPSVMEGEYLDLNYLRRRFHPYQLLHPIELTTNVHVIATSPIDPASIRSLTRNSGEGKFCVWSMNATPVPEAANECRLRFNVVWPASSGDASEYGTMRKTAAAASNVWEIPLVFGEKNAGQR